MNRLVWLALAGLSLLLSACIDTSTVRCATDSQGHTTCIDFSRPSPTR
jgi:hypothetical protein